MGKFTDKIKQHAATAGLIISTAINPVAANAVPQTNHARDGRPQVNLVVLEREDKVEAIAHEKATTEAARLAVEHAAKAMQSPKTATVAYVDGSLSDPAFVLGNTVTPQWIRNADVISMSYGPGSHAGFVREGINALNRHYNGLLFLAEGNDAKSAMYDLAQPEDYWPVALYRYKVGVGQATYDTDGTPMVTDFSNKSGPSFLYVSPFNNNTYGRNVDALQNIDTIMRGYDEQMAVFSKGAMEHKLTQVATANADAEYDALSKTEQQTSNFGEIFSRHLNIITKRAAEDPAFKAEMQRQIDETNKQRRDEFQRNAERDIAAVKESGILDKDGKLSTLDGTSFAAPSAAGDAAQLCQQYGFRNEDVIALMCLSAKPVHKVEGMVAPLKHLTNATGRLYDPIHSGWGLMDRDALYENAKQLAVLKDNYEATRHQQQTINRHLPPDRLNITEQQQGTRGESTQDHHVFTFEAGKEGRNINNQIIINFAKDDKVIGAYVTSPSGVKMYIPGSSGNDVAEGKIKTKSGNKMVRQTIINTDAFLGESMKGTWKIEFDKDSNPESATMTCNGVRKGCYLDKFIDTQIQLSKHASIESPDPSDNMTLSNNWVTRVGSPEISPATRTR